MIFSHGLSSYEWLWVAMNQSVTLVLALWAQLPHLAFGLPKFWGLGFKRPWVRVMPYKLLIVLNWMSSSSGTWNWSNGNIWSVVEWLWYIYQLWCRDNKDGVVVNYVLISVGNLRSLVQTWQVSKFPITKLRLWEQLTKIGMMAT
jgi:hypothetical protein